MNIFIKVLGGSGSRLIFQEKLSFPGSQDLEHPILVIIYKVTTPLWEYVIVTPVYNSGDTDGNPPSLLYEPKNIPSLWAPDLTWLTVPRPHPTA